MTPNNETNCLAEPISLNWREDLISKIDKKLELLNFTQLDHVHKICTELCDENVEDNVLLGRNNRVLIFLKNSLSNCEIGAVDYDPETLESIYHIKYNDWIITIDYIDSEFDKFHYTAVKDFNNILNLTCKHEMHLLNSIKKYCN